MCVCGDAFVGCFLPSRRRKCQAGNFAMFTHRREHGGRNKALSTDSLGPDCTDDTENLIRKAGTQESRKGISEIEGKGAMGSAEQGGSRASFNLRISKLRMLRALRGEVGIGDIRAICG